MRIAVVDHRLSAGGVSRFLSALVPHLAMRFPHAHIELFAQPETIQRDDLVAGLQPFPTVGVRTLPQTQNMSSGLPEETSARSRHPGVQRLIDTAKRNRHTYTAALAARAWLRTRSRSGAQPWYRFALTDEALHQLAGHDLVYLAWPFFIEPIELGVPVVATFHDLHFKHFPGSYNPEMLYLAERQTRSWLQHCREVIVSTRFIAGEVQRHYPGAARAVHVIPLAPYSCRPPTPATVSAVRRTYHLPEKYMMYSGSRAEHKNVLSLLQAAALLRDRGRPIPLLITGAGTDIITDEHATISRADPAWELRRFIARSKLEVGRDLLVLGYVPNEHVDALTQGAALIVSASLYEAGCGPAMDAWQFGVPVAFSSIPPFLEQLDTLGVEAWVFDPMNPASIADTLDEALTDTQRSRQMAGRSRNAVSRRTWEDVALEYMSVFQQALSACG